MDDLEKQQSTCYILYQALCVISKPLVYLNWTYSPETLSLVKIDDSLSRVTTKFEGWPKNNRAALFYCFKLCASFHSHQLIQTRVTVRKRPVWAKSMVFLSRETLKFDRWPWKTIGSLFSATTSFVYHFIAISEFKLELQSGNEKFGSKSMISLVLWNLTEDLEKQ